MLRTIAETYYKGADIGECLATAYRIKECDFESWYDEWIKTAKRIHYYAQVCISEGHLKSANEAFLRASNYYRTAGFLLIEPADPRFHASIELSKECFRNAISTFPFKVEAVEIPYEGTILPGYYYHIEEQNAAFKNMGCIDDGDTNRVHSDNRNRKLDIPSSNNFPTLIVHGGFDSILEELYSYAAAPALERGYNCLTFEGPGQGEVIRKQKIPFRYDWEKVVTPVFDFITIKRKEFNIDLERVVLMGISMGGYLAARAAAFEPRISACVLYDGVYDGYDAIKSGLPKSLLVAIEAGNSQLVNATFSDLMKSDPNVKFNIKHGMWTTGTNSPYELITGAKKYSTKDILSLIKCPTLVLEGEKDDSFPGQPKKVYEGLTSLGPSSKKYIVFTQEEGGEEHCQCGVPAITNQRIFDWLDDILDKKLLPP
ncbi:alpha/beta hydrolase family protein [Candidatus Nitrosocosmicus sp. T]